jgi:hypothetical protein
MHGIILKIKHEKVSQIKKLTIIGVKLRLPAPEQKINFINLLTRKGEFSRGYFVSLSHESRLFLTIFCKSKSVFIEIVYCCSQLFNVRSTPLWISTDTTAVSPDNDPTKAYDSRCNEKKIVICIYTVRAYQSLTADSRLSITGHEYVTVQRNVV